MRGWNGTCSCNISYMYEFRDTEEKMEGKYICMEYGANKASNHPIIILNIINSFILAIKRAIV